MRKSNLSEGFDTRLQRDLRSSFTFPTVRFVLQLPLLITLRKLSAHMLQASLVHPVAKLDIKDLLKPNSSSPPSQSAQPLSTIRSNSIPCSFPRCHPMPSPSSVSTTSHYSTITALPNTHSHYLPQQSRRLSAQSTESSSTTQAVFQQHPNLDPTTESTVSNKRPLPTGEEPVRSPAKRSSKWSPAEDAKIIRLRGKGMKWDDISKHLLGRSSISCRLHYQNYLERRSEWDEEKRNKLARVYDRYVYNTPFDLSPSCKLFIPNLSMKPRLTLSRLKPDLWNPIANELGVPWRAAEAMHWALGEQDMARRANVAPFSIAAARAEPHEPGSGRIAQRDRMLETTRVFEGRDLSTLSSPFVSVNGNGHGPAFPPAVNPYDIDPPSHLHIAPIKIEHDSDPHDGEDLHDIEDDEEVSRARKRRSGTSTRLPGLAELDGEVHAIAERERHGMSTTDRFEGRRGSGESAGSNESRENGRSG